MSPFFATTLYCFVLFLMPYTAVTSTTILKTSDSSSVDFDIIYSTIRNNSDMWPRDTLYTLASAATTQLSPPSTADLLSTYVNSRDATENFSGEKLKLMLHYLTRRNHAKMRNEDVSLSLLSSLRGGDDNSNLHFINKVWTNRALTAGKYDLFNLYSTVERLVGKKDLSLSESINFVLESEFMTRGELARRVFYLDTRYGFNIRGYSGLSITSDDSSLELLNTLLQWNLEYPVTLSEKEFNKKVYDVQGNQNPFVLSPLLVSRVYNSASSVLTSKDVRNFISLLKVTELDGVGNTILAEARAALNRMKLRRVPNVVKDNDDESSNVTGRKWTSYTFNKEYRPRRKKDFINNERPCQPTKSKTGCTPRNICRLVKSRVDGNRCILKTSDEDTV